MDSNVTEAAQDRVLATTDDLSIRTDGPVHSGKVRSVYFLTPADSERLIQERSYDIPPETGLAIMVVSDRISAFDCVWHGEGGLAGVPGKGAALNAVSHFWFECFRAAGLAGSHVLESPHPMVWVVRRARPVRIEAIARRYITGSLWRDYGAGQRTVCGHLLPEGLERDQRLSSLLITPSSKGVLKGLHGIPEVDDVNISRASIEAHWRALGFDRLDDVDTYERLLAGGFEEIERNLMEKGQLFVDTKFEFGYVPDGEGGSELIYMDEVGTPDSSRIWDAAEYARGSVVEKSKEHFRKALIEGAPDPDVLLNKSRMAERRALAEKPLPAALFEAVASVYADIAREISGDAVEVPTNPRAEIEALLVDEFGLGRQAQ